MKYLTYIPQSAKLLALSVLLTGATFTAPHLLAQERTDADDSMVMDDSEDAPVKLEPYVLSTESDKGYYSEQTLTGARYNKNIHDIPTAITIINKEMLNDLAAYDMLEPIKYAVSGITLNQPDADDFNIRGFRTRGGFRNGMRSAFGGYQSSTWDVERLEVLKGPASMLTGVNSSAIGGTVNYISSKPTETFNHWISTTVAEHDEWRLHAQSSGPIWEVGDTKFQYRVTGGLWDRKFEQPSFYHEENFFGAALRAITGTATTVTLEYSRLDKDSFYYDSHLVDPLAYDAGRYELRGDLPGLQRFSGSGPETFTRLNNTIIEGEVSHTFAPWLTGRFKYQFTEEKQDIQNVTITDYIGSSIYLAGRNAYESRLTGRASQYQLDLVSTFHTGPFKHELSGGLDYDDSNTQQHWFDSYDMPSIDIRNPDFSGDKAFIANHHANGPFPYLSESNRALRTSYSYYWQENLSFWKDRITLIGGWRTIDAWRSIQTYTPKNYTEVNDLPYDVYRHGLIIKPIKNVSLYATKAINFFPSTGQTANPGTPFTYIFPASEGEITEYGAKFNFLNGKIYGSFADFDLARTNVRSSRQVVFPDGTTRTIEAHLDTTTLGWEADLGTRLDIPFGKLDLVVTYYEGESTTPRAGSASGERNPAYNAPSYITSGTGKVTIDRGLLKGFSFGAAVRNESQVYMTTTRILQRPMVASLFTSYKYGEHISASLNVDNVTDEEYFITAGRADGEAALGRKFRFTVKYTF